MKTFILEQWREYLKRGGLDEAKMPEDQRTETMRAFYGGIGQMLIYMRDSTPDDEKKAAQMLSDWLDEAVTFWDEQAKAHNEESKKPQQLDEKGFFFLVKGGRIGWCRMYEGEPWFMQYIEGQGWITKKRVGQQQVWNAAQTRLPAPLDIAVRQTHPTH
jgi:hypothetical protein